MARDQKATRQQRTGAQSPAPRAGTRSRRPLVSGAVGLAVVAGVLPALVARRRRLEGAGGVPQEHGPRREPDGGPEPFGSQHVQGAEPENFVSQLGDGGTQVLHSPLRSGHHQHAELARVLTRIARDLVGEGGRV